MPGSSTRMLTLLSILQTQRDWSGHALAERLGVAPRTVRRDVDRLRELGYEIAAVKGPAGGYRMVAGSALPPLLFDDDQAVALAVALQTAPSSGVALGDASERALATLRQVLPARLRHRLDSIRFTSARTTVHTAPPVDPAVLAALGTAVRRRQGLRFRYRADELRRCEPHGVVARNARWYLIGWDLDREDWRIYRIDRMALRTPGGAPFTARALPAEDAHTFLAARLKGSDTRDEWPCTGVITVDLPMEDVAGFLEDAVVEYVSETSCRVTLGSWSWAGIIGSVIGFEAPFTIESPGELVVAASSLARIIAAAGRGRAGGSTTATAFPTVDP